MKDFLVTEYIFSPGTSGVGYVDLPNLSDFNIERIVSIINQTKGVIIYATGSTDKRYTAVSGNKIYLFFDTSTHSSTDKLQLVYNSSTDLKTTDDDQQNLTKLLSRLVKIMENQQSFDSSQRQRITIDAITGSLTLGTVTTVGTVTTCSTVTTCNTVGNVSTMAGMNQEQFINIARNTYSNSIRNRLFFG